MTNEVPASSENRLVTGSLSVHGWTESAYRTWFFRHLLVRLLAGGFLGMLVAVPSVLWASARHRGGYLIDDDMWGVAVMGGVFIAGIPLLMLVSYRWARRLALATTYEVWPEAIIVHHPTRSAQVIEKSRIVAVARPKGRFGHLKIIATRPRATLRIPNGVTDFGQLEHVLCGWCPSTARSRIRHTLRRCYEFGIVAVFPLFFLAVLASDDVRIITPLAVAVLAYVVYFMVDIVRQGRSKWVKRFLLVCGVWQVLITLTFLAVKWLAWLGYLGDVEMFVDSIGENIERGLRRLIP